jgi:uncharacterized membrane protein YqjE
VSTDVQDPPQQTASSLVTGILGDLQRLVEQQFQLTRREIEEELRQRLAAAAVFALGIVALVFGAGLACLSLTHLLYWAASPAGADPAWLPLWACQAMVAAVLCLIGGSLALVGRTRFRSIIPYHNPASEILQEHVPWTPPST